ncbi:hypothetical protein MRY82_06515 [bacterium]|nr:hypothetical protein [bacterium]
MKKILSVFSLFTSTATLLCCALPFLLVSIGAGAVLAGLVSNVPQIVWVSENKNLVFIIGGILLLLSWAMNIYRENISCPVDKKQACSDSKIFSHRVFKISVFIYCIGVFFGYILPLMKG